MLYKLENACKASRLREDDAVKLGQMLGVWQANIKRNKELMDYYEDNVPVKQIGEKMRGNALKDINVGCDWIATAVDSLCERSIMDGFTTDDETAAKELDEIFGDSFAAEYSRAVRPQAIYGFGGWAVIPGDEDMGEKRVIIKFKDAMSSSALWDGRRDKVVAAFSIEEWELDSKGREKSPSLIVMYTPSAYIEIERIGGEWKAYYKPNTSGVCPFVPMVYRKHAKRFGKSRISRAMMGIVDSKKRETIYAAVHSEFYSLPKEFVLNASDELLDGADKMKIYSDVITMFGKDEDGETVSLQSFQASSPSGHIEMMDKLALDFAASAKMPPSEFGVASGVYTAIEGWRAATDSIILLAKELNKDNGQALVELARVALAVYRDCAVSELGIERKGITVHWYNEAMPSPAQNADFSVKMCSVMPELAGSDICLELFGLDEDQRKRAQEQMRSNKRFTLASSVFGA